MVIRRALLLLALLFGVRATAQAQNVTELYVTPDTLSLKVGQKEGLSVQAFDNSGNAILQIRYRSSDERVARVQAGGTVTGVGPGSAQISVMAGKKTKSVEILVTGLATAAPPPVLAEPPPSPVVSVSIDPLTIYLLPTEHFRPSARGSRADGSTVSPLKVVWRSLRPEIATVIDSNGVVTAVASGQGVLQASFPGGASSSVPVMVALTEFMPTDERLVLSPGEADTLAVVVPAQQNRRLRNADLLWRSTDTGVATVGPGGEVKAVAPGQAEIVVGGYLQERRIDVVVHREIVGFATKPKLGDTIQVPLYTTREFRARAEAADSTPVPEANFVWQVGDTSMAEFDATTGLLRAKKLGSTTVGFKVKGFLPKLWTVRVVAGTVGIVPQRLALEPGERRSFTASYLDEQGAAISPASDVTWSSSNPAVATVSRDGTVSGLALGRTTVTAAVQGGQPAARPVFVVGDLLVSSTRRGSFGIYAIRLAAPNAWIPVIADSATNNVQGVYSPDRTRLAFSSDRIGPGNYDIFVADADGKNPVRLTTETGLDNQPVWTPDGKRIVFSSARAGTSQIFVMNADGSDVRQLTSIAGGATDPAVSPDGRRVACTGYPNGRDGDSDIFLVDLAGGPPADLTSTRDRREWMPAFLPAGEVIFAIDRKERKDRYQVVRESGTPLASSDLPLSYYAVSRDGTSIVWIASRVVDHVRGTAEFTFSLGSVQGGAPAALSLSPGERVASPAF